MVELFYWETQEARINLSGSGMEPYDRLDQLNKLEGDPKELLAELYEVEPHNIIFTHGAQESMLIALAALKPREVYIPIPVYPPVVDQAKLLGINVKFIDSAYDAPNGVIAMINPNNPTGELVDLEELSSKSIIVVDEIFKPFVKRDFTYIPGAIILMSTSKFFSIRNRKIGWIVAEKKIIKRIRDMRDLISPPPISNQELINYIVPNIERFYNRNMHIIQKNLKILRRLNRGFHLIYNEYMPVAVLYKDGLDDMMFAKKLLEEHNILLTPTTYFYMPSGLRISLGHRDEKLVETAINSANALLSSLSS